MYKGRYAAGGYGQLLDLDQDGRQDLEFSKKCGFIAQLREGKIIAVETDADVEVNIGSEIYEIKAFQVLKL
jgi:hypothetical protein